MKKTIAHSGITPVKRVAPATVFSALLFSTIWLLTTAAFFQAAATETDRIEDLSSYPLGTEALQGVIVNVISAGELVLWEKGRLHPFKLYGIDLPSPGSPGGVKAKQAVSNLVFNTLLRVYLLPGDASPPRGIVLIRGTCLNRTLVRQGTARLTGACAIPDICDSWKGQTGE